MVNVSICTHLFCYTFVVISSSTRAVCSPTPTAVAATSPTPIAVAASVIPSCQHLVESMELSVDYITSPLIYWVSLFFCYGYFLLRCILSAHKLQQARPFFKSPVHVIEQKEILFTYCRRGQRWCLWLLRKCIQTHSVLHTCPSPLQERRFLSPLSCGFSSSPPSSPRMQLCFKMFWDLSHYKGNCRQDAQPIPNS